MATLARLQRVNRALAAWDEHDATPRLPDDPQMKARLPSLGREALKGSQQTLVEVVGELERMWERRN